MNCDPNTISRAASCFRCLSDYHLIAARTFLLCRIANHGLSAGTPATPTGPDISDSSSASNTIVTWTNAGTGTTNEVWKSTDGVSFSLFATTPLATTSVTDSTPMNDMDMWFYKVRNCAGTTCSAFSSVVSVTKNYTSPNVAVVSFPTLIHVYGNFMANSLAALTTVSLPLLRIVEGNLQLDSNSNFTSLTVTNLKTVGSSLFLGLSHCNCNFPALLTVGMDQFGFGLGDFQPLGNPVAAALSAPLLTDVGNNFVFSDMPALTSVTLTNLKNVGMASFNGRLDWSNCDALVTISMNSLLGVGNSIVFNGCLLLATVNMTAAWLILNDTGIVLNGDNCPALVTWNAPNWQQIQNGVTVQWPSCALNAASVNQILAQCVASNVSGCTIDISGGTSAAPSGQGVADKATLIGNGNTVNTN